MRRFDFLIYNSKKITNEKQIIRILLNNKFFWLIDAEFEQAQIEIKNDTLIWLNGTFYSGDWFYGIWKNGHWKGGTFENGIWLDGTWYNGKFKSGIFKKGNIIDKSGFTKLENNKNKNNV